MADVLQSLDLALDTYSLAPCWDEDAVSTACSSSATNSRRSRRGLGWPKRSTIGSAELNIEYAAKRQSRRWAPCGCSFCPAALGQVGPPSPGQERRHGRAIQASVPHRGHGFPRHHAGRTRSFLTIQEHKYVLIEVSPSEMSTY